MSAANNVSNCFIIESGSDTIKYGFSNKDKPTYLSTNFNRSNEQKSQIIERGLIKDWNELEKVYDHIFETEFQNQQVITNPIMIITEPTNSFIDKEKMCQLLFEKFAAETLSLSNQSVLSLVSVGLLNGVVLNSGHSYTSAISICEGNPIKHSIQLSNVGGRDIDEFLKSVLNLPDEFKSDNAIYRDIKEKHCQISNELDKSLQENIEYILPDGNKISLDIMKLNQASNISFETYIIDYDLPNVQDLLFKSISKTQMDFKRTLYSNIVLTGGNTLFRGFTDRFTQELKQLVPKTIRTKVTAERNRNYSSWVGASMVAALNNYAIVSKRDYEEAGPKIITKVFP